MANYNTGAQEFALKFNQTGTNGVSLEMQSDRFHKKDYIRTGFLPVPRSFLKIKK